MKAPFAVISCLLALAISAGAQLVGITITSPSDPFNIPPGGAGNAFIPIIYTVAPDSGTTINAFSVTLGGESGPTTPFTTGKQTVNFPVPATLTAGNYPMVFTEKYTTAGFLGLNPNTSTTSTTFNIIIAAATSSTSPAAVSSTSQAPSSSSSPSPSPSPSSSSVPSSSSSTVFSSQAASSASISLLSSHASMSTPILNLSFTGSMSATINTATLTMTMPTNSSNSNSTASSSSSAAAQNTPVIIGSVCGFVAILAAGFGYAFLSKTRKNRRKERVFGDGDDTIAIPPPAPFDSPRAVGGVVGAPTAEERPDSWEPEVKHAPGALYNTTATPPAPAYYNQTQPGYGAYSQQQYAPGYYQQQQGYQQNPDIQLQNAQNWNGQYPQHNYDGYQGQGEYGYR